MTIAEWLASATKELEASGIETARLDCLVLLQDTLGFTRTKLLTEPDHALSSQQLRHLTLFVQRRKAHEPLAYIRSKTEFYKREFIINEHVLEPRPESETIIELLLNYHHAPTIIDVGTGSGVLAITVKLELEKSEVYGLDIDPECLKVAAQNAQKHQASIHFLQSDLLTELAPSIFDTPICILANLPYVPDDHEINQAAMNEPRLAIFGGKDGLDLYKKLFAQLDTHRNSEVLLYTESLPSQHTALSLLAKEHGFILAKSEDFIQAFSRLALPQA